MLVYLGCQAVFTLSLPAIQGPEVDLGAIEIELDPVGLILCGCPEGNPEGGRPICGAHTRKGDGEMLGLACIDDLTEEPAVNGVLARALTPVEVVLFVVDRAEKIPGNIGGSGGAFYRCHPQAGIVIGHKPVDIGLGVLGIDGFGIEEDVICRIEGAIFLSKDMDCHFVAPVVEVEVSGVDGADLHSGTLELAVGDPVDAFPGRFDLVEVIAEWGPVRIGSCRPEERSLIP